MIDDSEEFHSLLKDFFRS